MAEVGVVEEDVDVLHRGDGDDVVVQIRAAGKRDREVVHVRVGIVGAVEVPLTVVAHLQRSLKLLGIDERNWSLLEFVKNSHHQRWNYLLPQRYSHSWYDCSNHHPLLHGPLPHPSFQLCSGHCFVF